MSLLLLLEHDQHQHWGTIMNQSNDVIRSHISCCYFSITREAVHGTEQHAVAIGP